MLTPEIALGASLTCANQIGSVPTACHFWWRAGKARGAGQVCADPPPTCAGYSTPDGAANRDGDTAFTARKGKNGGGGICTHRTTDRSPWPALRHPRINPAPTDGAGPAPIAGHASSGAMVGGMEHLGRDEPSLRHPSTSLLDRERCFGKLPQLYGVAYQHLAQRRGSK